MLGWKEGLHAAEMQGRLAVTSLGVPFCNPKFETTPQKSSSSSNCSPGLLNRSGRGTAGSAGGKQEAQSVETAAQDFGDRSDPRGPIGRADPDASPIPHQATSVDL